MNTNDKKDKQPIAGCTCDDEFQSIPCQVHFNKREFESAPIIVDDSMMLNDGKMVRWEGFQFTCPICKEKSLMNNFDYCPNCGKKIELRSKIVTDFIKKATGAIK